MNADIADLSDALVGEIVQAVGLPKTPGWRRLFRPLLRKATGRLCQIGLTFDRLIVERGFSGACQWSLNNWCRGILARGRERVPAEGPLLVLSNHPGAYDALVVAAELLRDDVGLVASDLPLLRDLPNLRRRIFSIPINIQATFSRMSGLLCAVRHLRQGGAVLLMGSGTIDPDPAVARGAAAQLQRWTRAVDVFLGFVPEARVMLAAVSHVVSPRWARHPLTWLQPDGMPRRRLAEFGQLLQQLIWPGSLYVSPRLSFAGPLEAAELDKSPREAVIRRERSLLEAHCREFGGFAD